MSKHKNANESKIKYIKKLAELIIEFTGISENNNTPLLNTEDKTKKRFKLI